MEIAWGAWGRIKGYMATSDQFHPRVSYKSGLDCPEQKSQISNLKFLHPREFPRYFMSIQCISIPEYMSFASLDCEIQGMTYPLTHSCCHNCAGTLKPPKYHYFRHVR